MSEVCIKTKDVSVYVSLLLLVVGFVAFVYYKQIDEMTNVNLISHYSSEELKKKVVELENKLYSSQIATQRCESDLAKARQDQASDKSRMLNKIYNPLVSPDRIYGSNSFQQIGFIFNGTERFPLYGRYKFPGRTNKFEYYIIDESRNRLKIPFKSKGDDELMSGDTVDIATLGMSFTVQLYEYETFRYNPNVQ
jgi:hypothetical protein